jgi:hypothetical protein
VAELEALVAEHRLMFVNGVAGLLQLLVDGTPAA